MPCRLKLMKEHMKIKNTLSGKLEEFVPLSDTVGIYVCGLTVYDRIHLGHLRSFIPFDLIVRYLRKKGYKVKYVRNFTDIDDKIIDRAKREGISPFDIAEKYIKFFEEDIKPFELLKPDFEPRVTDHIPEIINLIEKIIENSRAYVSDGDVYFDVEKFPDYGKLSKMSKENMLSGARVEISEKKKNPLDFALWKARKEDIEPAWRAPWGEGRPGWHIECSAMSMKYLGETFDIHGGGQDLIFPHHENEIAQSESATGKQFVRYWLHTGYLTIAGEKMSKSLGNVLQVPELIRQYHPEVIKFFILKAHYRSPVEFSSELIRSDEKTLINFYYTIEFEVERLGIRSLEGVKPSSQALSKFEDALDDDFNTPEAISTVFSFFDELKKSGSRDKFLEFLSFLSYVHDILGIFGKIPVLSGKSFIEEEVMRRCSVKKVSYEQLCKLVEKRDELRRQGKYREADEIRKKLLEIGIYIQDTVLGARKIPA